MKKRLVAFIAAVFSFLGSGQAYANDFEPFDNPRDFLRSHFRAEQELHYALLLTKVLDQYLSSELRALRQAQNQLDQAVEGFQQAYEAWNKEAQRLLRTKTVSEEDLPRVRETLRNLQIQSNNLAKKRDRYKEVLRSLEGIGIRLVNPFTELDMGEIERPDEARARWRFSRLVEAVDELKSDWLEALPELYRSEPISFKQAFNFSKGTIQDSQVHIENLEKMEYDFDEESIEFFDKMADLADTLEEQYKELENQAGIAKILEGSFSEQERESLKEVDKRIEGVEELTAQMSRFFQGYAREYLGAADNIIEQVQEALPTKPDDPVVLGPTKFTEASRAFRNSIDSAKQTLTHNLVIGQEARELRGEIEQKEQTWDELTHQQNEHWSSEDSEHFQALKERLGYYDDQRDWEEFKSQLVLDYSRGFLKLRKSVQENIEEDNFHDAALVFLSMKGTNELIESLLEDHDIHRLESYLERSQQFLSSVEPKILEGISEEDREELEYVFGPLSSHERKGGE